MIKRIFWGIIYLLFFVHAGLAQEGVSEMKPSLANEGEPDKIYDLSLRDTVELALANNLDIQLVKYDIWIARTHKDQSRAIYDLLIKADVDYRDDESQKASLIAGTETTENNYNFGFIQKLPTGTTVSTDLTNARTDTTSIFATSQLTHDSKAKVTVSQTLGRNFLGIQDRGAIKVTLKDIENTQFTSTEKIEALIANVEAAYWDLALAKERVRIEEGMVTQAQRLYDSQEKKFNDKMVEKPELIATQANLQRRRNDLLLAQNQIARSLNQLKFLCNLPESNIQINPIETFDLTENAENLNDAIRDAFNSRADFLRAHNEIERQNIILAMSQNSLWPQINLTASLARNGLGDHFKEAINHISDQDNPELFAGLEFNFPLENSQARGAWNEAKLQKARALIALKLLERKIMIQIMDQLRDCQTFRSVAGNSVDIAQLQAQKFTEEEIRFNQGRSDTDTLIRFQEDLIQAQLLTAEAKHRYHLARIELDQKKGVLLTQFWPNGVDF